MTDTCKLSRRSDLHPHAVRLENQSTGVYHIWDLIRIERQTSEHMGLHLSNTVPGKEERHAGS
jgi:hypothetical protein